MSCHAGTLACDIEWGAIATYTVGLVVMFVGAPGCLSCIGLSTIGVSNGCHQVAGPAIFEVWSACPALTWSGQWRPPSGVCVALPVPEG